MPTKLIDLNIASKNPTMKFNLDVAQVTIRSRIRLELAELNLDANQPVALVVVMDESGSTMMDDFRLNDGSLIFPVEISAGKQLAFQMGPDDQLAVVGFCEDAREVIGLTKCDNRGRDEAVRALDRMRPKQSGTNYNSGLELAFDILRNIKGMTRGIAFLTDGTRDPNTDPLPLAKQILNEGIILCTAAISDKLKTQDEDDLKTMSGGANFKQCNIADDVANFLGGSLRKAKKAALNNVSLAYTAIGAVSNIKSFDRVLRDGKRNYVAGSITQKSGNNPATAMVEIGELGPDEQVDIYVEFTMPPVKAPQGKTFQERTFGELKVMGICPSQGITTAAVLGEKDMLQNFAVTPSGQVDPDVEKLEAEWVAASALAAAASTTNAQQQQDILGQAAAKVRRATQVFTDDDSLKGALTDLEGLQQQSRAQGAAAAAKDAGRKTAVFVDED